MERDCESELSKLNIEQNACIYHFGASVIHGQRSNILRLRFIYASKPESMYNEWGNFWDPNNKQRNLFQSIYNVYKEIDKEKQDCNEQLYLLSVQLSVLLTS